MFQTYEPVSDISFAGRHVPLLRAQMKKQGIDGFVIPHDDEYRNEYTPEYARRLMWISGFSGSAGIAVVMADSAVIFTDARYTLQVREEVDASFFAYADISVFSSHKWPQAHTVPGGRIGYDPLLHTPAGIEKLRRKMVSSGMKPVAVDRNPVDAVWTAGRPARPATCVEPHDIAFAGRGVDEKLTGVAACIREEGADALLLASPASIAWLFNIRARDVPRTPVPLGRALVNRDGTACLFLSSEKTAPGLPAHLGGNVTIYPESRLSGFLRDAGKKKLRVMADPRCIPAKFADDLLEGGAETVERTDPCVMMRAVKNRTEIEGARRAHRMDGLAVTRFLYWLDVLATPGEVDEITAAKVLEQYRQETGALRDISFDTISGAGANGAIVHYRVSTVTNRKLEPDSLYLVDSGGQYDSGTTDVTRTVPVGRPAAGVKACFTRVLKGHIALARLRFPEGTAGSRIDAIARSPLWEAGLDYDHGTGHGVGSFLGVHEGPQRISAAGGDVPLVPGMILSNEPGYYRAGQFGIRLENLMLVLPAEPVPGGERDMLSFETLTLAPVHRGLIDRQMLLEDERRWLDDYHRRVYACLSPDLSGEVRDWLAEATRKI